MERKSLDELFDLTPDQRREAEAIDQENRKILARHRVNQRRKADLVETVIENSLYEKGPTFATVKELLGVFSNVRRFPEQYPVKKR
jgi:hypothetical protein